jgi:hypothetical protein
VQNKKTERKVSVTGQQKQPKFVTHPKENTKYS